MLHITEDKINRAINESINDFIIEEGWLSDTGKTLKGYADKWGLTKAGNAIWNGLKMYMDWRTNGRWNNKYGYYVNGNNKYTSIFYLNKWFNYHLNQIRNIEQEFTDPSSSNRLTYTFNQNYYNQQAQGNNNNNNNSQFGFNPNQLTYNIIRDVPTYVARYVTPEAFNNWARNVIKDKNTLAYIDEYIKYCGTITNVKTAAKYLNIYNFISCDIGKKLLKGEKLKKSAQQGQPTQQQAQATQQQPQRGRKRSDYKNGGKIINLQNGGYFN